MDTFYKLTCDLPSWEQSREGFMEEVNGEQGSGRMSHIP